MCLMVYPDTSAPRASHVEVAAREIALDPGPHRIVPSPLAGKAQDFRFCDRLQDDWICQCVLGGGLPFLPSEPLEAARDPEDEAREAAAALAVDPGPLLSSGRDGDEALLMSIHRETRPANPSANRVVCGHVNDGGSGSTRPVPIRLSGAPDVH